MENWKDYRYYTPEEVDRVIPLEGSHLGVKKLGMDK